MFGCKAYVKVKDAEKDKLQAKAKKFNIIRYKLDDMAIVVGITIA